MRRRLAVAAAVAAAAAVVVLVAVAVDGCGDDEQTLRETSEKLSEVRSGRLSMRFVVASQSAARDSDVGFAIKGRFALATKARGLPQADLAYTQIAGTQERTARVVSDGRAAWVRVGEQAYRLPADRTRRLRRGSGDGGGGAGLQELRIDRWIADPKSSDGGEIDGVAMTKITGRLRVATALRDLQALSRRAGTSTGTGNLDDDAGRALEDAKENASITVHTGEDDRLLRRLVLRASFPLERARNLGGTIGRLRGAEIRFTLSLRRPNGPVRVKAPVNAQPLPASGGA